MEKRRGDGQRNKAIQKNFNLIRQVKVILPLKAEWKLLSTTAMSSAGQVLHRKAEQLLCCCCCCYDCITHKKINTLKFLIMSDIIWIKMKSALSLSGWEKYLDHIIWCCSTTATSASCNFLLISLFTISAHYLTSGCSTSSNLQRLFFMFFAGTCLNEWGRHQGKHVRQLILLF